MQVLLEPDHGKLYYSSTTRLLDMTSVSGGLLSQSYVFYHSK